MNQKKKILFIYYKLFKPGGVVKVLTNLANALVEEGHPVEILLLSGEMPHFYPLHPKIKVHYLNSYSTWAWKVGDFNRKYLSFLPKIDNINGYIYDFSVFLLLKNWMRKNHHHYHTIIATWYKLSSFLALNKKVNYKTVAWEHVTHETGGVIYNGILRKYYKNLKSIVCINTPAKDYYQNFTQTFFIPNIIGSPFENNTALDFSKKENIISFVGRLDKEKNTIDLLKIFKDTHLPEDWKLQIIGDGPERENLEKYISGHHLQSRVTFLGIKNSDEIKEILEKSKIFACTSLKEALPTVLIEALFCGNALLAYNCNYGPSDIINEKNGFLIPVHDQKTFKEALEKLAHDHEHLLKMMNAAYDDSKKWNSEELLKNWKSVLNN